MLKLRLQRFQFDPGFLTTLCVATFAAWPFLTRASLPIFTDGELHVYRTFEILEAWKAGVPYLRWAPDFFYAFGYPVFNYYSPLTYYLGAAYGWFVGGPVAGVKFIFVASAYLGAIGMYLFVRERWGGVAGVVSAAAFVLAPYTLYIDPHARGDSPETFAIAVAPLMLWAFARLRRTASPGDVVIAALTLAVMILSHNLMSLVFFGLLLVWLAWDVIFGQMFLGAWVMNESLSNVALRRKVIAALGAAVLLGLGLAAFMWLPAMVERNAIQFRNVASGTYFDFHRYFRNLRELFAPALIFDLGATQMRFNYSVGTVQAVLGGLGILSVFSPRTRRLSVLFFAFVAVILIYLMLPASTGVWDAFRPMAYLQFPTRLLGPTAVALSVLAGASVCWIDSMRQASRVSPTLYGAVAVALCISAALPLMYPPPWTDFGPVSAKRVLDTELNGRGIGTTSANDFLPIGVKVVPKPQPSLIESYTTGEVDKLNRATLPEGTQVTILEHKPEQDRFLVTGQTDFVIRPFTFYFPGWTAYVDGVKTPIMVADPDGWITFWVPAGTHEVLLRLENTPPRWVGWGVSALSLLGVLALAWWRLRLSVVGPASEPLAWPHAAALALIVFSGMGVRYAADQAGWWRVRSTGNEALVAQYQRFTPLEENIALLGYDLSQTTARSGDQIPVTLYWKALAPPKLNLRVFVHFIGPDGQLWGQSDKWNPADFVMTRWPLDYYVRDEHQASLRPDAPPGQYQVIAGLWNGDTGVRAHLLDSNGNATAADGLVLTTSFTVQ